MVQDALTHVQLWATREIASHQFHTVQLEKWPVQKYSRIKEIPILKEVAI